MKSDRSATWQVLTKISFVIFFVSCLFSHKIFVLLPEAVTDREEVPASLRVHVPYVCFLTWRVQKKSFKQIPNIIFAPRRFFFKSSISTSSFRQCSNATKGSEANSPKLCLKNQNRILKSATDSDRVEWSKWNTFSLLS